MTISLANAKQYRCKHDVWLWNKSETFHKRDLTDAELTTLKKIPDYKNTTGYAQISIVMVHMSFTTLKA